VQPIYTHQNTASAFQLNWSVSLFGRTDFPPVSHWLDQLKSDTERDGVRILEARLEQPHVGQFFISTRPDVAPSEILRSTKGRWQYLIRIQHPSVFRRNHYIGSLGDATCRVLDREAVLLDSRAMMVKMAAKKRWRLSRIGILSDHYHILLGANVTESPANVALSIMNNLAHVHAMKPVFRFSYYVGTFGPYDRDAVRRHL